MRRFLRFIIRCMIGAIVSTILFIIFFMAQRYNYTEPDQVYLMGTKIGYLFVFCFFFIVTFFSLSFVKYRKEPTRLKSRFFLFSSIYILLAPLVILSFDNYLLVTKNGFTYNRFFHLNEEKIHDWKEIEAVTLDYTLQEKSSNPQPKVKLHYRIVLNDGTVIDLNNRNSPLYQAEEFQSIHNVIMKHRVPIVISRPFPSELQEQFPFYYQLFQQPVSE